MMDTIVRSRAAIAATAAAADGSGSGDGGNGAPFLGVGAYSEGLNDDLNKAIWSAIAQHPASTVEDVVAQYPPHTF